MPNEAPSSEGSSTTAPDRPRTDVVILDGSPPVDPTIGTGPAPAVPGVWARLHGLAVALPLGAWGAAVLFDVVSTSSSESMWARGAMWMVIIGLVGAAAAAVFGALDAAGSGDPSDRRRASIDLRADVLVAALVVVSLVIRRSKLDDFTEGTPILALVLLALAVVVALSLSWTGRSVVFRTSSMVPVAKIVDLVAPATDLPHVAVSAAKAQRKNIVGDEGAAATPGSDQDASAALDDSEAGPGTS